MGRARMAAAAGAVTAALGVLFALQGLAVVGPESSFMYSDPGWTGYGALIAAAGAAVLGAGIAAAARG